MDAGWCTWDRVTAGELCNLHTFLCESGHFAAGRPVTDGGEFAVMDDSFPLLGQLEVDCRPLSVSTLRLHFRVCGDFHRALNLSSKCEVWRSEARPIGADESSAEW